MLVAKLLAYVGFVIGCLRIVLFQFGEEGFEETVVSLLVALILIATGFALASVHARPQPDGKTAHAKSAGQVGDGAEGGATRGS